MKFNQLVNPLHSIEQVLRDGAFDRLAKIVSRACLPIRRQWRREPETLKLRRPSQVTNKGGPSGMGRAFHMPAVCTGFTRISVDLPADSLQTKHMQLRRASRGHSGCQCMSKRCQLYCTRVLSGTMVSRIALVGGSRPPGCMETPALRLEARAASDQAGRRAARACDSKTLLLAHARAPQRKRAARMVSLAVVSAAALAAHLCLSRRICSNDRCSQGGLTLAVSTNGETHDKGVPSRVRCAL